VRAGRIQGGGDTTVRDIYISPTDVTNFWKCTEERTRGKPFRLFIATDQDWIVSNAQSYFGEKHIVYIPGSITHINRLNAIDPRESPDLMKVLLDHWLQGEADEMIITSGSTFGSMAAIRAGKLPLYISKGHQCGLANMELGPYHTLDAITW